ncbi:flagellin [Roseobacter sp. S98]|uniref:flagellin N-terminal helical domain-containing protein n=1 Tax=Roseobacter algicola (ex Choi et al. 2025) (nom. illeg.) TaxID=3092138 RepID=UPI0035C66843
MSSILTNNSAMVALQTLKSINMNLGKVQSEISTGKTVESAKDNAATWAISKVMSSDVSGFEAISDSLGLGQATVGVSLNAAESVTDLLTEIKGKIVNSQEENVDRAKIQTDIEALRDQISSIVGAAQFNGLNLLKNDSNVEGSGTANILSSLDRGGDGTVTASNISVAKQDLDTRAAVFGSTAVGAAGDLITTSAAAAVGPAGATPVIGFTAGGAEAGASYRITLTGAAASEWGTTAVNFEYVAADGDTELDVSNNLLQQMNDYATANGFTNTTFTQNTTTGAITVANTDVAANTLGVAVAENLGGTSGGGLADLATIDVSTADGATAALASIESLIQTSIDSAASLGSDGRRIEAQSSFVSNLIDGLKSGIGTLVDADMEAASAKLQALQTQQQLGVQALSIANQAPQTILSLFR